MSALDLLIGLRAIKYVILIEEYFNLAQKRQNIHQFLKILISGASFFHLNINEINVLKQSHRFVS